MESQHSFSPLTCSPDQLHTIVTGSNRKWLLLCLSNPAMTEDHVIALLRNPAITAEVVQSIAERNDWLSNYQVQVGIAGCPRTPFPLALRMFQGLFWNDLLKISMNFRVTARLRQTAETYLREKVPALTLGEKKSLARTAPRGMIGYLRHETEKDVFAALLQNPRLVEDDLLVVISNEVTPTVILETICLDHKWSSRYTVRFGLVRNHRTPLRFALSYLSKLKRQDLMQIVHSPRAGELVRRSAARLLEEG